MKTDGEQHMTGVMTSSTRSLSEPMQAALKLPDGARFYRCALQVNPFSYLERHSKPTPFQSEDEYNKAMVEACLTHGTGAAPTGVQGYSPTQTAPAAAGVWTITF